MSGIYVHIPFCSGKCHYCNFFSTVSLKHKEEVVNAIVEEINLRKDYLKNEVVSTIYYGGGTPTVLSDSELNIIHQAILNNFSIQPEAEITVEANPDDLNEAKLLALRKMGVNRLSIGTQAFDDKILQKLNRRHSAKQAITAVENAKKTGFDNVSIDLIYGIPDLDYASWKAEIHSAIAMDINHISAYHLTVEPGTALDVLIRKKKYPSLDENMGMEQFDVLIDELSLAGFEHYEISNFAKPNHYSIHNTNYWKQKKYLGLGPSAHSYDLNSRQWNIPNLKQYYLGIKNNQPAIEYEILSSRDKYNEFIMLALRTKWGVNPKIVEEIYPERMESFIQAATAFKDKGLITISEGKYILTKEGKKLADGIAAEFFCEL